ncbi:NUDIX hydrolase [Clostridium sp. YIM B02555]|uniref:NUDIX hydrolase n=1 Tax=Clostridium sp. YIM B02555 TaxID=2911968 RepID=UPI001EEEBD40|nr:NUDIX hydrolase [Clostridium sp. YIM B02555]
MSDIKILEVIERGREGTINIFNIQYLTKSGKEAIWNMFSRKNKVKFEEDLMNKEKLIADGVIICSTHKDTGKLVVLKEYRVGVNTNIIAFPGGLVDQGETYEETAIRELKEETNLDLVYIDKNRGMKPTYSAIGITDETVAIVYGECIGEPKDMQDDNEQGKVLLLSKEDVEKILQSNEYQLGSRTELIFENYLLRGGNLTNQNVFQGNSF